MDGVIFLTFSIGTLWLSTSLAQYLVHIFRPVSINIIIFNRISRVIFLKDFDIKLFQPTVANFLIIVWLFIYCFYGHLISWKCREIGDFTYCSLFYKYPLDLRMFTLFMITRSQRPFYITGYKLTKCSLDSYARVI